MNKEKIRVAIVGTGRISDLHAIEYMQNPNAEIVALCDTNIELAKNRAKNKTSGKERQDVWLPPSLLSAKPGLL